MPEEPSKMEIDTPAKESQDASAAATEEVVLHPQTL